MKHIKFLIEYIFRFAIFHYSRFLSVALIFALGFAAGYVFLSHQVFDAVELIEKSFTCTLKK
jgi:hypothetical protein